jgi:HK97 family phage major capsid protein
MAFDEVKTLIEEGTAKVNLTLTAMRSELDSLKSADVVSTEKIARMETDLAAALAAKQAAELKAQATEDRLAEVETKLNRPGGGGGAPEPEDEYKTAFIDYVRDPQSPAAQTKMYELSRKATDTRTSTAGSGGYALPEQIARDIAKQVQDISPIRAIARVVQVGTPDYKELVNLNGFGTEWVGETTTRAQTDTPDLGECAPTFGDLAAKPEATRHSLEDLFFDVEGWLTESAAEQYAIAEGQAFVAGDGSNKPTGFLDGTPVNTEDASRAFGVLQYVATGAAAALSANPFDEMHDLAYTLKAGYRGNARWVMNSNTMAAFAKVKSDDGVYLLQASQAEGAPDRINGYGVTIAEDMPGIAANAFPVAFGDFQRGYVIADRVGMGMVRDEVTKPGYIRFMMYKRVGGKLKDTNAIKLLRIAAS